MRKQALQIVQTIRLSEENSYIVIGVSDEGRITSCQTLNDDMISKEADDKISEIEFVIKGMSHVN